MSSNRKECFWACTLTADSPTCLWPNQSDDNVRPECLFLRMATLGKTAKEGERNLVEVETRDCNHSEIRVPVFSLRLGGLETIKLNMTFDEPAAFHLADGTGPVCITAKYLCAWKGSDESDRTSCSESASVPNESSVSSNEDTISHSRKNEKKRRNGRLRLADYVDDEAEEDNRAFPSETDGEIDETEQDNVRTNRISECRGRNTWRRYIARVANSESETESDSDCSMNQLLKQKQRTGSLVRARQICSDDNTDSEADEKPKPEKAEGGEKQKPEEKTGGGEEQKPKEKTEGGISATTPNGGNTSGPTEPAAKPTEEAALDAAPASNGQVIPELPDVPKRSKRKRKRCS